MLLLLPVILPAVLLIRAIKPIVKIRFRPLSTEVIGILAAGTELYMCRRDKAFDVFYFDREPCNHQLCKMWSRVLHVWQFSKYTTPSNRVENKNFYTIPKNEHLVK